MHGIADTRIMACILLSLLGKGAHPPAFQRAAQGGAYMKKALQSVWITIAASCLLISGCTLPLLKHTDPAGAEIVCLIQEAPEAEAYPEAPALVIFDQDLVEVFPDGSYKATYRKVVKIIAERGKDYGDIRLGFDSRMQQVKILHAFTTTPDGGQIPLKKNAMQIVTPFSWYPAYTDYKQLTFSMPGVTVGSIIDYEILVEGRPHIAGEYSHQTFFQGRSPVLLARARVVVPRDRELQYLALNPPAGIDPAPAISEAGDRKVYLWEFRDIPQILDEG
jgi:hypothetical protein